MRERAVVPIVPTDAPLHVDGRTRFVAVSPPFLDDNGTPLIGRTVSVSIVPNDRANVINPALSGYAVSIGEGRYSRAFFPELLVAHLAPHAHGVVLVRWEMRGRPYVFVRHRVVWRTDSFPPAAR